MGKTAFAAWAGLLALSGCISPSPRVVPVPTPDVEARKTDFSGDNLYLTRFEVKDAGLRDSKREIGLLREQFLSFLKAHGGYRSVIDATADSKDAAARGGFRMEAELNLGLEDKPNRLVGLPAHFPLFGLAWPATPRSGNAIVSGKAALLAPDGTLLGTRNWQAMTAFDYTLYAWLRTGPIQEAYRASYRQVFERLAQPLERPETAAAAPAAVPRPGSARRPHDFALVVGVDKYQSVPRAPHAESDAQSMRDALVALGVPEENVVLLTGDKATRSGLARYLEEWLPKNVTAQSRVYFYYSGHGAPDSADAAPYLIPWDGEPAYLKTSAYSVKRLYGKLAALPAAEIVAVLDSCFSGSGGRSVMASGARPLVNVKEPSADDPRLSVLTAAAADQIAGTLDKEGHGLLTYFVLRGLRGEADADDDKRLTMAELGGYVRPRVMREARRQNREQTPQLRAVSPVTLY